MSSSTTSASSAARSRITATGRVGRSLCVDIDGRLLRHVRRGHVHDGAEAASRSVASVRGPAIPSAGGRASPGSGEPPRPWPARMSRRPAPRRSRARRASAAARASRPSRPRCRSRLGSGSSLLDDGGGSAIGASFAQRRPPTTTRVPCAAVLGGPRSLPRARRDPEPAGEERAVADRVQRFLRDCGLDARRGRRRAARRLDDGEPLRAARADRRGRAAVPLRAPRHRAADGRDRAGRRGRHRPERAAGRSSAPTTRRPSRRCSRRRGACSPRAGRTPGSSCSSRRRRRSACSARSRSTTRGCARRSATSTTRRRRSATSCSARRRRRRSSSPSTAAPRTPGMYPEEGRSAIFAAAKAIAEMRLGRIDEETTANVGLIEGGTAVNIVPEHCKLVAEARSHDEGKLADLVQEMQDAITFAAGVAECEVETQLQRDYRAYRFKRDDTAVASGRRGADALRLRAALRLSGRRSRRERLQRARPAVREPRQRHGRDPHARRAHRGRRPRRDGRRHARARRRRAFLAAHGQRLVGVEVDCLGVRR